MNDDDTSFEERLALGWQALSSSPGALERVRARLPATPLVEVTSSKGAQQVSRWRAPKATGGLGTGAAGLLLGLGFASGWFAHREWAVPLLREVSAQAEQRASEAPPSAVHPVAPDASSHTDGRGLSNAEPVSAPAPTTRRARAKPRAAEASGLEPARAARAMKAGDLELALIQRAERAVRAKNGELALALSAELDEKFPSTKFSEERQAIALMARCQCGSADRVVERERFGQRYPSSVYGDRIAIECGPDPRLRTSGSTLE